MTYYESYYIKLHKYYTIQVLNYTSNILCNPDTLHILTYYTLTILWQCPFYGYVLDIFRQTHIRHLEKISAPRVIRKYSHQTEKQTNRQTNQELLRAPTSPSQWSAEVSRTKRTHYEQHGQKSGTLNEDKE